MLIKASTISNLTDARYFAAKDVNWLGFNLEEGTDGYIDPIQMKNIREWVSGPKIVGEFKEMFLDHVLEAAEFYELDAIQITSNQLFEVPDESDFEVILALYPGQNFRPFGLEDLILRNQDRVNYFLMDYSKAIDPEAGFFSNFEYWKNICEKYPMMFQFDFSPSRFPEFLEKLAPNGIAVRGGDEEKIGVKSFDDLDEIFEILSSKSNNDFIF